MNNANSAAFPCEQGIDPNGNWNQSFEPGLTKREYFAGLAMQSLIGTSFYSPDTLAEKSVEFADELLKALEAK